MRAGHKVTPIATFIIITGFIYLWSTSYMPGTVLSISQALSLFQNLKRWAVFSSLFTDEETVAESSEDLPQSHAARKWQSWMSGFSCHVLDENLILPYLI